MRAKLSIIIVGILMIHGFFDFLRDTVKTPTAAPESSKKIVGSQKPGVKDVPSGFSKYKWGADRSSFPEMQVQNRVGQNQALYKFTTLSRDMAPEYLDKVKPINAYAMFTNEKLNYVTFQLAPSSSQGVLDFLQKNYGKTKSNVQKEYTSYRWESKESVLVLVIYKDRKYSLLQVVDKKFFGNKN